MTVWAVYLDYDHEGFTEPRGIFSSKEKADAYVEKNRQHQYQTWVVEPYEVDAEDA